MSYASVQGNSLGGHSTYMIPGNSQGVDLGSLEEVFDDFVGEGTFVFSLRADIFASNATQNYISGEVIVYDGSSVVAKQSFTEVRREDVCIAGLLFSDGETKMSVTFTAYNYDSAASAVSWGWTDGKIDLVRISSH